MTRGEIRIVVAICSTADGGCSVCAGNLYDLLSGMFPEHQELIKEEVARHGNHTITPERLEEEDL